MLRSMRGGAEAELPLGRRGDLPLVGERAPHPLHEPLRRRQRQEVRRGLRAPRRAVGDVEVADRREAAWPVEVDEPEPALVLLRERPAALGDPRAVGQLGCPTRVPVEELVDGNDLSHGNSPKHPACGRMLSTLARGLAPTFGVPATTASPRLPPRITPFSDCHVGTESISNRRRCGTGEFCVSVCGASAGRARSPRLRSGA